MAGADKAAGYEEKVSPSGVKWYTDNTKHHPPYVKLVRLIQIVAESLNSSVNSQKTKDLYENLSKSLGAELHILLKTPLADISKIAGEKVAQGVGRVRKGEVSIEAGYDGEYGKVKVFPQDLEKTTERNNISSQLGIDF